MEKMKTKLVLLSVLLLIAIGIIAGCGGDFGDYDYGNSVVATAMVILVAIVALAVIAVPEEVALLVSNV